MYQLRIFKQIVKPFFAFLCVTIFLFFYYTQSNENKGPKLMPARKVATSSLYVERLEHLNEECKKYGKRDSRIFNNRDLLDHILVDKKHQLLYCYIPKVACTNWKRMFMILNGGSNKSDILTIPANLVHTRSTYMTLANFSTNEAKSMIENYTKFLIVRHPFERLLSAYRNKLEKTNINSKYFKSRLGRYIIKNFRPNPTNLSLANGDDVTFQEFTTYLTASSSNSYNEHWKPMVSLCEPCIISYNFIGKYETILADSNLILRNIGLSNLSFPSNIKPSNTAKVLKKYFSTLTTDRIKELYMIYKLDFKLFSYKIEDLLGYEIN